MRSGLNTEVVEIYKPIVTKSEYGEDIKEYKLKYTTRARVQFASMSRAIANAELIHADSYVFYFRRYVPIVEDDILLWQNRKYYIQSHNLDKLNQQIVVIGGLIND